MSYLLSDGIAESELAEWIADAKVSYGCFSDGRVDYTKAKIAPVVMCIIAFEDRFLLVKRGHGLADANGYWSSVSGFIDSNKPASKQAALECEEELGLVVNESLIKVGKSYTLDNPLHKRKYIVFPCLVRLKELPKIKLSYENTEYKWIYRKELESFHILEDLAYTIDAALSLS